MRCATFNGTGRCDNQATHEFIRASRPGARWRPVCLECLAIVRRHAHVLDGLRIRPLEVDDRDEKHRRRAYQQEI